MKGECPECGGPIEIKIVKGMRRFKCRGEGCKSNGYLGAASADEKAAAKGKSTDPESRPASEELPVPEAPKEPAGKLGERPARSGGFFYTFDL